jgi:cell division protein ZapA (FtsZ GTPase activity inhibitor)
MTEPARVELTVLGQTLTLRSEADPAYLRRLAASVEARVAALQRGGVRDQTRALILAALEISDELERAREDRSRAADDVEARLDALVRILDGLAAGTPGRP